MLKWMNEGGKEGKDGSESSTAIVWKKDVLWWTLDGTNLTMGETGEGCPGFLCIIFVTYASIIVY